MGSGANVFRPNDPNRADEVDGVKLPRGKILGNAFVLLPFSGLASQAVYPVAKQAYQQI